MYCSLAELKSYLAVSNSTAIDDNELLACIEGAQQEIENYCGRTFESSTGTRYYQEEHLKQLPYGSQYNPMGSALAGYSWDAYLGSGYMTRSHTVLYLDRDLLSVDSLTNGDATAVSSSQYWLEPRNSTCGYWWIRLKSGYSWLFDTDGEITIAGTWGYSTAPDATIKEMTKELAAYLYQLRKAPIYDVTAQPDMGVITVPKGMPVHVKMVLDRGNYVRRAGW